jgi:dienelactone hydrolase
MDHAEAVAVEDQAFAQQTGRTSGRVRLIDWWRDLGRTLDYLKARPDIDRRKIAYYGFSSGAWYSPMFQALDRRFAANILLRAGICLVVTAEQVVIQLG